jgi:hypothetical protein
MRLGGCLIQNITIEDMLLKQQNSILVFGFEKMKLHRIIANVSTLEYTIISSYGEGWNEKGKLF